MKSRYTVSQAAKLVEMSGDTLRYYDRIGLVRPSEKNAQTKYRYYTPQDIQRLQLVHALQQLDIPLQQIRQALDADQPQQLEEFLLWAEARAEEKIRWLLTAKARIRAARTGQEEAPELEAAVQPKPEPTSGPKPAQPAQRPAPAPVPAAKPLNLRAALQYFSKRNILLLQNAEAPSQDPSQLSPGFFYDQLGPDARQRYELGPQAGFFARDNGRQLFAVCTRSPAGTKLKALPAGAYLCAACSAEQLEQATQQLVALAKKRYRADADFAVQLTQTDSDAPGGCQVQVFIGSE